MKKKILKEIDRRINALDNARSTARVFLWKHHVTKINHKIKTLDGLRKYVKNLKTK